MLKSILIGCLFVILLFNLPLSAQVEYIVHDRGMLHESIFNQGSLGQIFSDQKGMPPVPQPSMEWPPYSKNIINDIVYPGQHNSPGSSLWIQYTSKDTDINGDGKIDYLDRMIAPGGGVARHDGKVTPVISAGWIFPLELSKQTNYQVLDDGSLNPDYNPNEADEIITSKWATWIGVTVTRKSRVWSDPDYDDLVIYELTFENTGNTDYDESTIELPPDTLKDFTVFLRQCFSPSQFGYWRHYNLLWRNRWGSDQHGFTGDPIYFYDFDYWLAFLIDGATNMNLIMAGKPEPNPERFYEWSRNSHNGGGMLAHQAIGYCILHYDTQYLAKIFTPDSITGEKDPRSQSDLDRYLIHKPGEVVDEVYNLQNQIDQTSHTLLQPLMLFNHDGQVGDPEDWYGDAWMHAPGITNSRYSEIMNAGHPALPERNQNDWIGRRVVRNKRDQRQPITMGTVFGPYYLPPGAKVHISYAEVIGYGGAEGKNLPGGFAGNWKNPVPSSDRKLQSAETKEILTEHYLTDFGYPDHVNSNVRTVQDVAHKAWELYLGREIAFDPSYSGPAAGEELWPKNTPQKGAYHNTVNNPIVYPSPNFELGNTPLAKTKITWGREIESFPSTYSIEHRMKGQIVRYKVYRSFDKQGWTLVDSVEVGNVNNEGKYVIIDNDEEVKTGNSFYYTVTAVDDNGNESSKVTFIHSHSPTVTAKKELGKVYAVPNPFYLRSGFSGSDPDRDNKISFYGLTENCNIRIFSASGQLIQTLHHNFDSTSNLDAPFYQVTVNNQRFASGVYYFVVTDNSSGKQSKGKFIIIK